MATAGARAPPTAPDPLSAFNIIYSSGTTGTPTCIVQPHAMRWAHVRRGAAYAYGPDMVSLVSTPLYSNTTLVVFFPTLAAGGTLVLLPKFDVAAFLALAEARRVTHAMLVPVQYQRLMAWPQFDALDLSAFRMKFCTSAPFPAALKAEVLRRWPGGLVEYYGMTEGGGSCVLPCHLHPTKLHTVGLPAEGNDIRLIDDEGRELKAAGESLPPAQELAAGSFAAAGGQGLPLGAVGRPDSVTWPIVGAREGARVLLVIDDTMTRLLASESLRHAGFAVSEASAAEHVLSLVEKRAVDLLLLVSRW